MAKTTDRRSAKPHRRVKLGNRAEGICPTTGKRKFATRMQASNELERCHQWRARQGNPHVERSCFLCAQCMQYHLTSQENR